MCVFAHNFFFSFFFFLYWSLAVFEPLPYSAYLLIYDRIEPLPDMSIVPPEGKNEKDISKVTVEQEGKCIYTPDEQGSHFPVLAEQKQYSYPFFDLTQPPLTPSAIQELVPRQLFYSIHRENSEYIHECNIFTEPWVKGMCRLFDIVGCRFFHNHVFLGTSLTNFKFDPLALPRETFLRVWVCFLFDTYLHNSSRYLFTYFLRNLESLMSMDVTLAQFFVNELIVQIFPPINLQEIIVTSSSPGTRDAVDDASSSTSSSSSAQASPPSLFEPPSSASFLSPSATLSWLREVYLKCGDPNVTLPFSKLLLTAMRVLYVHGTWEELALRLRPPMSKGDSSETGGVERNHGKALPMVGGLDTYKYNYGVTKEEQKTKMRADAMAESSAINEDDEFNFLPPFYLPSSFNKPPLPQVFTSCLSTTYPPSQMKLLQHNQPLRSSSLLLLNHLLYVLLQLMPCNQPRVNFLTTLFLVFRDFASFGAMASLMLVVQEYPFRAIDFILGESSSKDLPSKCRYNKDARSNLYDLNKKTTRLPERASICAINALVSSVFVVIYLVSQPLENIKREGEICVKGKVSWKEFLWRAIKSPLLCEFTMGNWSDDALNVNTRNNLPPISKPHPPFFQNNTHAMNAKQLFCLMCVSPLLSEIIRTRPDEAITKWETPGFISEHHSMCREAGSFSDFILSEYVMGSNCLQKVACVVYLCGDNVLGMIKKTLDRLSDKGNNKYKNDCNLVFVLTLLCLPSYDRSPNLPSSCLNNNHPLYLEGRKGDAQVQSNKDTQSVSFSLNLSTVKYEIPSTLSSFCIPFTKNQQDIVHQLLDIICNKDCNYYTCPQYTFSLTAYVRVCPPLRVWLLKKHLGAIVSVCRGMGYL
jgi:hypothetical protein